MKTLIQELNKNDFQAFPQKNNPQRVTLSVDGGDGHRYFLTREKLCLGVDEAGAPVYQLNEAGEVLYQWMKGNAMRDIQATPTGAVTPIAEIPTA